ncbi:MAG TPA: hypothetical protein VFA34_02290 [Actinomycetota bacterium]|nr:hypothetical protein [Actinomycetota bacterium]
MRWHVELNENGTPVRVEHVDDEGVATTTVRELAAETHGGHARASTDEIERALGRLADEGLGDVVPGVERSFEINEGVSVVVVGLEDADTDDQCARCRRNGIATTGSPR